MGTLHLHPSHPIFKQMKVVACPTCMCSITSKDAVEIENFMDGSYTVRHKICAERGPNKFG